MKNIRSFMRKFSFLVVKCSIYLNRRVFVMSYCFLSFLNGVSSNMNVLALKISYL